jgi:hypothetical protein
VSNYNKSEKSKTTSHDNEGLFSEIRELKAELSLLQSKYELSEKRVQELEEEVGADIGPNQFRKTLHSLREETEKLRIVYPVHDLLVAKEVEVEKIGKALASVSEAHPEFESFELRLKTHLQELDELRSLAATADQRFKRQILRIRTAGLMIPFEVQTEDSHVSNQEDQESVRCASAQELDIFGNPLMTLLPPV